MTAVVRRVAKRSLVSATTAPVVLIGGWTVAAALQPEGFDSVSGTISALAAVGAPDRWVMTTALVCTGACHLVTASGFYESGRAGRVVLAVGGVATIAVAAFPLRPEMSVPMHVVAAGISFLALSVWPLGSIRREPSTTWALRPGPSVAATAGMLALLGGFVVLQQRGAVGGAAERVTAAAQALWPLAAVWAARRNRQLPDAGDQRARTTRQTS